MPAARTLTELVRASSLFFGGPLLGDPDRQPRTAAGSPTDAADREAIASPTKRTSVHFGNIPTRARCASRAQGRARAVGRPSPMARPAFWARHRHASPAPAKRRRRSQRRPRTKVTSRSITPATTGTSKPRLGTTWDVFRRPRRPRHTNRIHGSLSHDAKQTKRRGTFQPRSRTFPNVPNVPKGSLSTDLQKRHNSSLSSTTAQAGRFNGVFGRFTGVSKRHKSSGASGAVDARSGPAPLSSPGSGTPAEGES
jgi:hypothetical protein